MQQAQRRSAAYRAFKEAEAATLLRRFQKDARLKQCEHMRDTAAAIANVKDCLRGFATAVLQYMAVAARTQVFLDLAEYASLKRYYKQKLDKSKLSHSTVCAIPHVQGKAHALDTHDYCHEKDTQATYAEKSAAQP